MMDSGQTEEQVLAAYETLSFIDAKVYVEKYNKMQRLKDSPAHAKM